MVVFSRAHESGWHPRNFFSIATDLQRALAKLNERMGSILELSVKLRNVNSVRHHRHTTLDTTNAMAPGLAHGLAHGFAYGLMNSTHVVPSLFNALSRPAASLRRLDGVRPAAVIQRTTTIASEPCIGTSFGG